MNKLILLGIAATVGAARLAFLPANPPVELQPASPGSAQTGHLNISGTATVGLLKSKGTVFGESTAPTGFAYGGFFTAASNQARGFYGYVSSPTGLTYGGFFQNASVSGRAVYGLATATTGFNYGGYFQTASSGGRGILGVAASATGTTYGVYGTAVSPDGYAIYADGRAGVSGNLIVGSQVGSATSKASIFDNRSAVDASLYVLNGASPGVAYAPGRRAIIGSVEGGGPFATGVVGAAKTTDGSPTFGLVGEAQGSGANYGIYASGVGGSTNWAGYFEGALYAASANAGVKAFMIDHPLDPENRVLSHSSVESNERKNIYDGVVRTDGQGFATVTMPSWFEALNQDFRYQLTVNGDEGDSFVQVKVARKLQNGKFRIRTSAPYVEVNWMVTGNRHDATSQYYPLEVERLKNKDEQGKYYVPEAFGKDPSLGMGYMPMEGGSASKRQPNPPSTK